MFVYQRPLLNLDIKPESKDETNHAKAELAFTIQQKSLESEGQNDCL